jgi:hypothetical protein
MEMAEKPAGTEELVEMPEAGTRVKKPACPVCGEPRGDETPCPHCGMN